MAKRFSGTTEQLKHRLSLLDAEGKWSEINPNQHQFRHEDGGVLNWFPSTGTLNFQGKPSARDALSERIARILDDQVGTVVSLSETKEESHQPAQSLPLLDGVSSTSSAESGNATFPASLGNRYCESELVIGLVGAVGAELSKVVEVLKQRLRVFGYEVDQIRVSELIPKLVSVDSSWNSDEYLRISRLMDAGDEARKQTKNNAVLALGAAATIAAKRQMENGQEPKPKSRQAYIIDSLKHPEEVQCLREIYSHGFFLIGVHSEQKRRLGVLVDKKRISEEKAERLMERDEDEHTRWGQRVTDTFHLSDFFVRLDGQDDRLEDSLWRILDITFGHPNKTPTFDEYAMFLAFAASLRSADLSRQVGAVIAKRREILSTGANDCPKYGGGLYWPESNEENGKIEDKEGGRDYTLKQDSNRDEQRKIIEEIVSSPEAKDLNPEILRKALESSRIRDLTEFGRVVHAEMEAMLSCARNNVSTREAVLYSTTFPCHNCAKHIIAAGIRRVVFIEPYQKSKAADFHPDAISIGFRKFEPETQDTVYFEPFVGVGPRRFFDLFSMRLGAGYALKRKDDEGQVVEWNQEHSKMRMQMLPFSYLDLEIQAKRQFESHAQ